MATAIIRARGHKNVTATHSSTFEITVETEISMTADCIIAVSADLGAAGLGEAFKTIASDDDAIITATITCDGNTDIVQGRGSARMTFTDETSMVFRISDFICGRTVMISADKSASRLNRSLISALADGKDALIELQAEKGARRPEPSLSLLFEE
ncbi:MAG TPA: DUF371 domain-containing protein [Methanocella sp.]|nr:DUF371 domain-containing protein [Methanocella sp.]